MADTKITALTALTGADPANDVIPIVDVSDTTMAASGTTKKISVNNILGASGTATLASATITGDLTVGTGAFGAGQSGGLIGNGKQVVFTNNSGSNSGWISNADNACIYSSGAGGAFAFNGHLVLQPRGSAAGAILFGTGNGAGAMSERYRIASDGVATWSNVGGVAGTAMTLNSTGLGVGGSPTRKLSIVGSGNTYANINSGDNTSLVGVLFGGTSAPSNGQIIYNNTDNSMGLHTAGAVKLTIDSSGNVGISVQPSAWGAGGNIQGTNGFIWSSYDASVGAGYYYASGSYKYISTAAASIYQPFGGTHKWFTAAGGQPAGTNFTPTQAMTLDASGNLLVGKTANYGTGENNTLQLKSLLVYASDNTGSASNRNWSVSTNGSAAGNMDWTVSSSNNGWPNFAYRMQLTSAGAAYNTTGTWGTISDSRLKENISDARNYLSDLLKLRVVKYSLKEEASAVATKLGLIAQEVEQVFPSLVEQSDVAYDGGDGIRTVKTSILVPMLLKAIQELTARVQTLETR